MAPISSPYRSRLLWSSNGKGLCNSPKAPLSAAQLVAAGPSLSELIDLQGVDELLAIINVVSLTGGTTPSITFELDHIDDDDPGNTIPLWKPAAVTAAGKLLLLAGTGQPSAAPTVTGYTVATWPQSFGVQAQFKWTVAGGPTAVDWRAFLYGKGRM